MDADSRGHRQQPGADSPDAVSRNIETCDGADQRDQREGPQPQRLVLGPLPLYSDQESEADGHRKLHDDQIQQVRHGVIPSRDLHTTKSSIKPVPVF